MAGCETAPAPGQREPAGGLELEWADSSVSAESCQWADVSHGHVTGLMVTTENMVSRRKILSQSRDELSYVQEEEEDVWYTKDKLYKVEIHISIENLLICLLCHKAMMCIIDLYLAWFLLQSWCFKTW